MANVVIQQVDSASLLIDNKDEWIHMGPGMIVYVCFLKEFTEAQVQSMALSIVLAKIRSHPETKKSVSILEAGGDLLIIPQASLSGKLKGNTPQYHTLIGKEEGLVFYNSFVSTLEQLFAEKGSKSKVLKGTYGNRQGLKFESQGPFSHNFVF